MLEFGIGVAIIMAFWLSARASVSSQYSPQAVVPHLTTSSGSYGIELLSSLLNETSPLRQLGRIALGAYGGYYPPALHSTRRGLESSPTSDQNHVQMVECAPNSELYKTITKVWRLINSNGASTTQPRFPRRGAAAKSNDPASPRK
jgi:hypothetical protein